MKPAQIVVGCLMSVIAVLLGVYVSFTARGKGPIFSNTYVWLSKEEQAKTDRKAEYRQVTVIYGCMAAMFALLALQILTDWLWPYFPAGALALFILRYAIASGKRA